MDKQTQAFFERLDTIFKQRVVVIEKYEGLEIFEVFMYACGSVANFYFLLSQNKEGKEVLLNMFSKASDTQLEEVHRLLIFLFLWQRDRLRGLNFLKSGKVRDGLKNIWSFNELEINNLEQEFNSKKEPGMDTYHLWKKLQIILGNNKWSPVFVFPVLSASLKEYWALLDLSVGDNIQ